MPPSPVYLRNACGRSLLSGHTPTRSQEAVPSPVSVWFIFSFIFLIPHSIHHVLLIRKTFFFLSYDSVNRSFPQAKPGGLLALPRIKKKKNKSHSRLLHVSIFANEGFLFFRKMAPEIYRQPINCLFTVLFTCSHDWLDLFVLRALKSQRVALQRALST